MSTPGRRVTSAEVAQHSGVSGATVSYVLILAAAVVNTLVGKPTEPGPGQDVIQLIRRDGA